MSLPEDRLGMVQLKLRQPVNGLTHLAAALLSAVGMFFLLWLGAGSLARMVTFVIYALCLILLFSSSSAYHLLRVGPRLHEWLRRLDHSAIFLLIAGSFTPISYLLLSPPWRWLMLGSIWGIALAGVGYKLIAGMRLQRVFVGIYLAMGWLGVVPALLVFELLPLAAFMLMLGGGLLYSVGAIFYATNWPNPFPGVFGAHEIWHLFVIGGATSHYLVHVLYLVRM